MLVEVEDGRATRLRGDPQHPVTRGFLCGKVARYLEREYSPQRLLYPQRRTGAKGEGRFERITWDAALDEIAARLRGIADEWGAEAILPYSYGGTMGLLNGAGMDRRFFHRLGASRLERTICATAGTEGMLAALGSRYGIEPGQFANAKLILAWGANVLATNAHLWPFIVEARRRGARFYTIDPHRNRTGAAADRHYFIHPGSDTALALAMMHVMVVERLYDADYVARHTTGFDALAARVCDWPPARAAALTGIPAGEIAALAREYATTRPAAIRLNYGVQRSERGGMAVRAISLLPVLAGAWKHPGGGLQLSTWDAFRVDTAALERPDLQPRPARRVNMTRLGAALATLDAPPVKALVVYNSNPAATLPHQNAVRAGLRRDDLFTVVLEQFPTETSGYADILLPATTFLEHTDLYPAYGHYYLQMARPVVAPPGEAKSNREIFRLLAERMGFTEPCFSETEDEMIRAALASGHPHLEGITLERLEREGSVRLNLPEPFLPYAEGGYGTASGKCEFNAETLDYAPPVESRSGDTALRGRYPLEMITPKHGNGMNSTPGLPAAGGPETRVLHMDPEDAGARGISAGDEVRVFNGRGACLLRVLVDGTVRAGVVAAPGCHAANVLTSDRLTDLGGGPVFYNCLVEVEVNGAKSQPPTATGCDKSPA